MMSYNSRADVVHLLAEWYDTESNVKLGWFWSQLQVSYVSSHTKELGYNETACLWMTIYIYIYILSISWPIFVKEDLKSPFSAATTLKWREGGFSFSWTVLLILDLYLIRLIVKQGKSRSMSAYINLLILYQLSVLPLGFCSWTVFDDSNALFSKANFMQLVSKTENSTQILAQLAGAVEYTDCFFAEE